MKGSPLTQGYNRTVGVSSASASDSAEAIEVDFGLTPVLLVHENLIKRQSRV